MQLADCFRNGFEVQLKPGAGNVTFGDMFRRVEGKGFTGLYPNAFGSLDDMPAPAATWLMRQGRREPPFEHTARHPRPETFALGVQSWPRGAQHLRTSCAKLRATRIMNVGASSDLYRSTFTRPNTL